MHAGPASCDVGPACSFDGFGRLRGRVFDQMSGLWNQPATAAAPTYARASLRRVNTTEPATSVRSAMIAAPHCETVGIGSCGTPATANSMTASPPATPLPEGSEAGSAASSISPSRLMLLLDATTPSRIVRV